MKVLVVTQYFYPEDFKINDVVKFLVQQGHQVTVLTSLPNYPNGDFYKGYGLFDSISSDFHGAHIYRTPVIPRKQNTINLVLNYISFPLIARIKAIRICKEFQPDVMLGFQLSPIWSMLPATLLKRRYDIPLVLWCLDLWPQSFFSNFSYRNRLVDSFIKRSSENIYKTADYIAVTTKSFITDLASVTNNSSDEFCFLPNWAEEFFTLLHKGSFRFEKGSMNVVFAGNIGESQGLEMLLKAAEESVNDGIYWHIFGSGRHEGKLRLEAERRSIKNLLFHGRVDSRKLPEIYNASDALLLTLKPGQGYSKTMPGKFAGYLTSGTPIISNIEGEVKSIIESNGLGVTFSGDSHVGLLKATMKVKSMDEDQLLRIRTRTKDYYLQNFSKAKVLSKLEELLHKATNTHRT